LHKIVVAKVQKQSYNNYMDTKTFHSHFQVGTTIEGKFSVSALTDDASTVLAGALGPGVTEFQCDLKDSQETIAQCAEWLANVLDARERNRNLPAFFVASDLYNGGN
jgi:hypothetical protein